MTSIALRGLATRKLRSAMVAFAVVLGVAMIAGSFVLTDTIRSAFTGIYKTATENSDVVISGKPVVEFSQGGDPTLTQGLLTTVVKLDGVKAAAVGIADDYGARLTDDTGKLAKATENPTMALGFDAKDAAFSPLRLSQGRWATGQGEVVLDVASAQRLNHRIGGSLRIIGTAKSGTFRIVGTATIGGSSKIGGATVAAFDLATAQAVTGKTGQLDQINVAARPGTTAEELVTTIQPELPATAQVLTRDQEQAAELSEVNDALSIIQQFLLAFAGIALFVGAFVIFNTLSITVAQRTRELATLRLIGASRRQIRRSVVAEGAIIGMVGSLVGLGAGIGLAKALNALFAAAGLDLPTAGTVIETRTIVWSLVVGTVVTIVASLIPAMRATRIAPTAAVREGLPSEGHGRRVATLIGVGSAAAGVIVTGTALLIDGLETRPRMLTLAAGLIVLFMGMGLVLPRIVTAIARFVGAPSAKFFGEAGRLGRDNAVRNPGRTAATAAALMVGLALISSVAALGQGLRKSDRDALAGQINATHVVSAEDGFSTLPAAVGRTIASTPGVSSTTSLRQDQARDSTGEVTVSGVDPSTAAGLINVEWADGSDATLANLTAGQVIISESHATSAKVSVGNALRLTTSSGKLLELRVAGISRPSRFDSILGPVVVTQTTFDANFPRASDGLTLVTANGSPDAATSALRTALADTPNAVVRTSNDWVIARSKSIDTLLNLLYVLLGLSVAIALLGMVNTLALSVMERTRELGTLRALGASRRQLRRMVRHESIVVALIGAAVGLPLGVGLAALVTQALSDYDVSLSLPIGGLIMITLIAVAAAVIAASGPARRASRVQVVQALAQQ